MTMFPERQEAIRVLYYAAARLLDNAGQLDIDTSREINRDRSRECVELAEKIARMGPVMVSCDERAIIGLEIDNIPFSLGFVVRDHDQEKVEVKDEPNAKS